MWVSFPRTGMGDSFPAFPREIAQLLFFSFQVTLRHHPPSFFYSLCPAAMSRSSLCSIFWTGSHSAAAHLRCCPINCFDSGLQVLATLRTSIQVSIEYQFIIHRGMQLHCSNPVVTKSFCGTTGLPLTDTHNILPGHLKDRARYWPGWHSICRRLPPFGVFHDVIS